MSNFRVRLTDIRQKARSKMAEGHVSTDVQELIQDLLEVTVELERQLGSAEGQSGDLRVLRSRNDMLAQDLKKKEQGLQDFKKNFLDIVIGEIRTIGSEVAKIVAATQGEPDGVASTSAKAIGQRLRSLVESLSKT